MLIQLLRQFILFIPFMWCLEKFLKITGIWLCFPVTEVATFVLAILLLWTDKHKMYTISLIIKDLSKINKTGEIHMNETFIKKTGAHKHPEDVTIPFHPYIFS